MSKKWLWWCRWFWLNLCTPPNNSTSFIFLFSVSFLDLCPLITLCKFNAGLFLILFESFISHFVFQYFIYLLNNIFYIISLCFKCIYLFSPFLSRYLSLLTIFYKREGYKLIRKDETRKLKLSELLKADIH